MRYAAFLLVTILFVAGCEDDAPRPPAAVKIPIGFSCTVQFRRDALGTGATLPVPPLTDSMNGAQVSVSGKIVKASEEWLVLESDGADLWIPRQNVLLEKFNKVAP